MVVINGANCAYPNNCINFKSNTIKSQNSGYLENSVFNNTVHQGDTFVSSNKESESNKKVLWGIGAAAAVGIGALACVLSKGKVKTSSIERVAKSVEFSPAKTVEEAKQFANDKLGLYVKGDIPLDVMNYTNEGLSVLKSKTPKNFNINWIEAAPIEGGYASDALAQLVYLDNGLYGIRFNSGFIKNIDKYTSEFINNELKRGALTNVNGEIQYIDFFKKTNINEEITDLINRFQINPSKLSFKEKMKLNMGMWDISDTMDVLYTKYNGDISKLNNNVEIISSPFHPIFHESGHALHRINVKEKFELSDTIDILKQKNLDTSITQEFINKDSEIAQKVSDCAKESPGEFVAEVYAKLLEGAKFDDEVMALYKKYGGPSVVG